MCSNLGGIQKKKEMKTPAQRDSSWKLKVLKIWLCFQRFCAEIEAEKGVWEWEKDFSI